MSEPRNQVLLLEDDPILSKEIISFLETKGIKCEVYFDGELFSRKLKNGNYDAFLLDINVPKLNGLDVCKRIRETNKITPIIMLTAFGEIEDKIDAFSIGADDYLVKPFHLEELYLRIQSLIKRVQTKETPIETMEVSDLVINVSDKVVTRNNVEINLTPKEFRLICILGEAKGKVVSKQQISEILWDYHIETNQNTIEVYINFLRNKIDKNQKCKLIHTKVGFGYYLKEEE
jgi:DNA-binding response OmpR family regulator